MSVLIPETSVRLDVAADRFVSQSVAIDPRTKAVSVRLQRWLNEGQVEVALVLAFEDGTEHRTTGSCSGGVRRDGLTEYRLTARPTVQLVRPTPDTVRIQSVVEQSRTKARVELQLLSGRAATTVTVEVA
jgi:hypothetical protein